MLDYLVLLSFTFGLSSVFVFVALEFSVDLFALQSFGSSLEME
jgi:hypothetical protein